MKIKNERGRLLSAWTYMPGFLMITLGSCILVLPQLLPAVVAGFFVILGLLSIQMMRRLRAIVIQMRKHLEYQEEEPVESTPYGVLPNRVYTSWIN